ncbi:MAG: RidA family protein [Pseudomonadota bacterium]
MKRLACLVSGLAALFLAGCSSDRDATTGELENDGIRFVATDALKSSGLPLSNLVEADGWLFLSGSLGFAPGEGLVPGGIEPETRQTMQNIEALLSDQGLGMDSIVKCTVMLADMAEWPAFNEVYKEFFDENFPARSAFGASGLAANARVEVECIARR